MVNYRILPISNAQKETSPESFSTKWTDTYHETISELHRLGTGGTELARDDDFATLGTRFHNESENTISGSARISQKQHGGI